MFGSWTHDLSSLEVAKKLGLLRLLMFLLITFHAKYMLCSSAHHRMPGKVNKVCCQLHRRRHTLCYFVNTGFYKSEIYTNLHITNANKKIRFELMSFLYSKFSCLWLHCTVIHYTITVKGNNDLQLKVYLYFLQNFYQVYFANEGHRNLDLI